MKGGGGVGAVKEHSWCQETGLGIGIHTPKRGSV